MPVRSEIQYAAVSAAAASDNELVAAVAGKRIRVHSLVLVASGGANTATLRSDTTGITGAMDLGADGQLVLDHNPAGWFQTAAAEALNLLLSAATLVAGSLTYSLIE